MIPTAWRNANGYSAVASRTWGPQHAVSLGQDVRVWAETGGWLFLPTWAQSTLNPPISLYLYLSRLAHQRVAGSGFIIPFKSAAWMFLIVINLSFLVCQRRPAENLSPREMYLLICPQRWASRQSFLRQQSDNEGRRRVFSRGFFATSLKRIFRLRKLWHLLGENNNILSQKTYKYGIFIKISAL